MDGDLIVDPGSNPPQQLDVLHSLQNHHVHNL